MYLLIIPICVLFVSAVLWIFLVIHWVFPDLEIKFPSGKFQLNFSWVLLSYLSSLDETVNEVLLKGWRLSKIERKALNCAFPK